MFQHLHPADPSPVSPGESPGRQPQLQVSLCDKTAARGGPRAAGIDGSGLLQEVGDGASSPLFSCKQLRLVSLPGPLKPLRWTEHSQKRGPSLDSQPPTPGDHVSGWCEGGNILDAKLEGIHPAWTQPSPAPVLAPVEQRGPPTRVSEWRRGQWPSRAQAGFISGGWGGPNGPNQP